MAETIKICGLSTAETVSAAVRAGADMVGFVFFAKSPRNVSYETARALSRIARGGAEIVALCVDATDATLNEIVAACEPDYLQLHGSEDPERVAAIQRKFGVSAIKAIGVAVAADLAKADAYRGKSDALLIDAKPPKGAALPGGNGMPFDGASPPTSTRASRGCCRAVSPPTTSRPRSGCRGRARSTSPRASRARRASRTSGKSRPSWKRRAPRSKAKVRSSR